MRLNEVKKVFYLICLFICSLVLLNINNDMNNSNSLIKSDNDKERMENINQIDILKNEIEKLKNK